MQTIRSRFRSLLLILAVSLILHFPLAVSAAGPPGADEIFLTGASEEAVTIDGRSEKRWVPNDTKLAFAWSDRPFAIHVPFSLETEIRRPNANPTPTVYAKDYDARLYWRGMLYTNWASRYAAPAVLSAGVYRFDGEPPYVESPQKFYFLRRVWLHNLEARTNQTVFPYPLDGRRARAPGRAAFCLVVDPREMAGADGGISAEAWKAFGEKVTGKLSVTIAERKQPTAVERRIEFLIRQNGWVFHQVKTANSGDWSRVSTSRTEPDWRYEDLGTTTQGITVTAKHRMIMGAGRNPAEQKRTDVDLILQLPPRVFDHLETYGTLTMRHTSGGTYPSTAKYGLIPISWGNGVLLKAFQFNGETNGPEKAIELFPSSIIGHWPTLDDSMRSRNPQTGLHTNTFYPTLHPAQRGGFTPEKDRLNALVWNWPPGRRGDSHRLITVDYNFLATYTNPPARHFDFYALRIGDQEDNRSGRATTKDAPVAAVQVPDDGFYTWLTEFRRQTDAMRQKISEIKFKLQATASQKQKLWSDRRELMRFDHLSFRPLNQGGDLIDAAIGYVKSGARGGRDISLQPTLTRDALLSLQAERKVIAGKIDTLRAEQSKLLEEADRVVKALVTSALIQAPKTDASRRQQVWDAVDRYEDQQKFLKLELMEAGEWFEAESLQKAINDLQFSTTAMPELAAYMQGLYWYARAREYDDRFHNQLLSATPPPPKSDVEMKARGAWIEALIQFRKVLQLNPRHAQALQKRAMIEIKLVQMIAAKLDAEQRLSWETFQRFVTVRGYNARGTTNIWDQVCEASYIIFTQLPSTLAFGVTDTVGKMADQVDAQVTHAARNQVSLMAISRLLRKGMSLEAIPNITPKAYQEYIPFKAWSRVDLPAEHVEKACLDIRLTFEALKDLQELVGNDRQKIEAMMDRNYFASYDPETSWTEFAANIFINPVNLLGMFGPNTIIKVGGKWQGIVRGATLEQRLLDSGGKALTLGEVFNTAFKIERIGAALSASQLGALIQADAQVYNSLHGITQVLNSGSRVAALILTYIGTAEIASQHDITALKVLVEALGVLNLENYAYDLIVGSGAPVAKLVSKVDELAAVASRKRVEFGQAAIAIRDLELFQSRLSPASGNAAKTLSEAELNQVRTLGQNSVWSRTLVAGENPEADLHRTLREAYKSLEAGDVDGVTRALDAARKAQKECVEELESVSKSIIAAGQALAKPPGRPALRRGDALAHLEPAVGNKIPTPLVPSGGYPPGEYGSAMAIADMALRDGDFARAARALGIVKKKADEEGLIGMQRVLTERLQCALDADRFALELRKARRQAKLRGNVAPPASAPITTEQLAEWVRLVETDQATFNFKGGSLNPVWEVTDPQGNIYIFKYLVDPAEIERECGGPALANLVGSKLSTPHKLQAPASVAVDIPGKQLSFVGKDGIRDTRTLKGVISRYVKHREYWELTESELLALKEDYAIQRAFRLWLGDTDGNLRNQLRGADDASYQIDFGFAEFGDEPRLRQLVGRDRKPVRYHEQDEMMLDAVDLYRGWYEADNSRRIYGWMARMDDCITFDDMKEAVEVIHRLCTRDRDELERIVLKNFGADRKDSVMKVLIERGEFLEDVLRRKFDPKHPDFGKPIRAPRIKTEARALDSERLFGTAFVGTHYWVLAA